MLFGLQVELHSDVRANLLPEVIFFVYTPCLHKTKHIISMIFTGIEPVHLFTARWTGKANASLLVG